jgi:hypothetical protein
MVPWVEPTLATLSYPRPLLANQANKIAVHTNACKGPI